MGLIGVNTVHFQRYIVYRCTSRGHALLQMQFWRCTSRNAKKTEMQNENTGFSRHAKITFIHLCSPNPLVFQQPIPRYMWSLHRNGYHQRLRLTLPYRFLPLYPIFLSLYRDMNYKMFYHEFTFRIYKHSSKVRNRDRRSKELPNYKLYLQHR